MIYYLLANIKMFDLKGESKRWMMLGPYRLDEMEKLARLLLTQDSHAEFRIVEDPSLMGIGLVVA